ncbi:MAG: hypothetical protein QME21_04380 [Anaerolineales bacterium]|nr:hypothetical protein [Anaerolineales bacterium]
MSDKPSLRTRIERACFVSDGTIVFKPEHERVVSVLTKLAKGHALYELHEQCIDPPDDIFVVPLTLFDNTQRDIFERPELPEIWPEVGSRMMQRLVEGTDITLDGWIIVQPERYRYNASVSRGIDIRIVIQEYLAGYIHWD